MRKLSILGVLLATSAFGADLPAATPKTSPFSSYPYTTCGPYFGLDTVAITGSTAQGEIGGLIGYSCPLGTSAFWFAEGMFNFANLNSTGSSGINLTGPASFEQRLAIGSPLSTLASIFPSLGLTLPTLPLLPTGVTVTTTHPYMFVALHEQDISATLDNAAWSDIMVSPGGGLGVINQLSNGVALDVFAEAQFQNKAVCLPGGAASACTNLGTLFRGGVAIKF